MREKVARAFRIQRARVGVSRSLDATQIWRSVGWFLLALGVTMAGLLSYGAFLNEINAVSSNITSLPAVQTVDQTAVQRWRDAQRAKELAAKQQAVQTSNPPTTTARRNVRPAPAVDRLIIPKIGLNAQLATVGLTATGAVDVNPNLPAWWNGSAALGQPGAAFIDGHNPGVFRNLGALAKGDQISVQLANGTTYTYQVVDRVVYDLQGGKYNPMGEVLQSRGGSAGLNLMTCWGSYDPSTGTYTERLVIYAALI
jgi:sortase (surface protein transpeptidase)